MFYAGVKLIEPDAVDGGDFQGALNGAGEGFEARAEELVGVEYLAAFFIKDLPRRRQVNDLAAAREQGRAEFRLQALKLLADGRLGQEIQPGAFGEAFCLRQVNPDL